MAKKYTTSASSANVQEFANALTDFYGSGVTIHNITSTDIIFSIPQITNKVLRFSGTFDILYTGDAWTSGTTITNQVLIFDQYASALNAQITLSISDNGFIFQHGSTNVYTMGVFKISTGDAIGFSFTSYDSTTYTANAYTKTLSDNQAISMIDMACSPFNYENGDLATFPIYLKTAQNKLITNPDSTPATVSDLKYCSQNASALTATSHIIYGGYRYGQGYGTYGVIKNGFILPLDQA